MLNAAAPTSEERAVGTVEAIVDVDDEEGMLNTPLEDEVEQERHRPREPLVCILQSFTAVSLLPRWPSIDRLIVSARPR